MEHESYPLSEISPETLTEPMPYTFESIDTLAKDLGVALPNIKAAKRRSDTLLGQLIPLTRDAIPPDAALVVFGSLARGEMTQGSDLDWALLVDGQATHQHQETALKIQAILAKAGDELHFEKPNATGAFGGVVFSHDLVHAIGGGNDTNANLTLRMLLLLEAKALAGDNVLDRVRTTLLRRYFSEEHFSERRLQQREHTPRFLLNDMVRFWRTIAVDYATKLNTRGEEKWALRNTKLRFSRKLLFSASLLICYELDLNPLDDEVLPLGDGRTLPLVAKVAELVGTPPLEIVARALHLALENKWIAREEAAKLLQSYDAFLGLMDTKEKRDHLAKLSSDAAETDEVFANVRDQSERFRAALMSLFFAKEGQIAKLSHRYAIF